MNDFQESKRYDVTFKHPTLTLKNLDFQVLAKIPLQTLHKTPWSP